MNALRVSPRQLFEASRLADRTGSAFMQELAGGRLLVLLSTGGQSQPDLALELDRDGQVVARQVLDLTRPDEDDEFSDLAEEEQGVVYVDPFAEGARPAPLCGCPDPFGHDGTCARCGRTLREVLGTLPQAA
jgi:hypothetical protein